MHGVEEKKTKNLLGENSMTTFNPEALSTRKQINSVCKSLSKFLHVKDGMYGSSISEPIHVFAKNSESGDLLYARIDDKINRIRNSEELRKNDVVDLMGYLVWVCIKKGWFSFRDLID